MKAKKKVLALFPGQGSQQLGMGKEFYENTSIGKELFDVADHALGFSLSKLCFEGPADDLTATEVVQPAILTVSTICFRYFKEKFGQDVEFVAAAGHSLGEYSALVAAGVLDFADAVQLVNKRGKYMQEAVPRGAGKMLAVLGSDVDELESALKSVSGLAQIANVNAPGQIVVSGEAKAIDDFKLKLPKLRMVELAVSAPFHCALMQPAADRLALDLDAIKFSEPEFPVYANFSGQGLLKTEEMRQALKDQVCGRVRWIECVQAAIMDFQPDLALEFGNGRVLSGLMKRIDSAIQTMSLGSIKELDGFVL
jgi:[acyl-carrier-protein] S-malonyltransferase